MVKNKKIYKAALRKNQISKRKLLKKSLPTANRKYKDTVFRMLFADKVNLLSLYNAISRTAYEDVKPKNRITIGYCRVSSHKQKDDLKRQIDNTEKSEQEEADGKSHKSNVDTK